VYRTHDMGNCYQTFEIWDRSEMIETHDASDDYRGVYSPPRWTPNRSDPCMDFHSHHNSSHSPSIVINEELYRRKLAKLDSHDFGHIRRKITHLSAANNDEFSKLSSVVQSWKSESPDLIFPQMSDSSYDSNDRTPSRNLESPSDDDLEVFYHRSKKWEDPKKSHFSFSDLVYAIDFDLNQICKFPHKVIHIIKDFLLVDMRHFISDHEVQTSDRDVKDTEIRLRKDGTLSQDTEFCFMSNSHLATGWAIQSVTSERRNLKMYNIPTWVVVFTTKKGEIVPYVDIRFHEVFKAQGMQHHFSDHLDDDSFEKKLTISITRFH